MSDAACDQKNNKSNSPVVGVGTACSSPFIEEHWRKNIILVQIWREVLRVILFAGQPGEGLDEKSKREMWFLLVAAGSGYLARCWHKTLKPKPLLADRPHDGAHDSQDQTHREADGQRVVDNNNNLLLTLPSSSSSSPSPQPQLEKRNEVTPLDAGRIRKTPELAPKPLKRSFSPKALGKKLFASDGTKSGKASKSFSGSSSLSAGHRSSVVDGEKEGNRSILPGLDNKSSLSSHDGSVSVGHSGSTRRSPWSSFRSHSNSNKPSAREGSPGAPGDDDDSSAEYSPGCFKRAGDSFRKGREWRRSDTGSFSSRSLQNLLGGDGADGGSASAGSSKREIDPPDSLYSSSSLTNRSFAAPENSDPNSELGESPEVTSRKAAAENEATKSSSTSTSKSNSPDAVTTRKDASSTSSVAAVVARMEKDTASAKADTVNAILYLRAANQAQAQAQAQAHARGQVIAVTDIVRARTLKLGVTEKDSVDDGIVLGGKGKRRAGDTGGKAGTGVGEEGKGGGVPTPPSAVKRTKDSKDSKDSDSSGVTLTSITSKWRKDASFTPSEDPPESFGEPSTSSGIVTVDLSQVFFGFDSTFLSSPTDEKSPYKFYRRSRQLIRSGRGNIRKMRESPRPMSALESCLRAQFPDRDNEGSRVARSLNFSSSSVSQRAPQGRGGESPDLGSESSSLRDLSQSDSPKSPSDGRGGVGSDSEQQSPDQSEGALGLPLLVTPPSAKMSASGGGGRVSSESASKYPRKVVFEERGRVVSGQSKLTDVLLRPTTLPVAFKKRKVSQACASSTNSTLPQSKGYEFEALVIPPMEGLLFCFGVGIGVMSLIDGPDDKVERLSRELQKSEEQIKNLNNLLRQAGESAVVHTTASISKKVVVADRFSSEEVTAVVVGGSNESPMDPLSVTPAIEERSLVVTPGIEETERQFDLYRREAPETPQQTEQMAELEAELEAELDALTSSITDVTGGPPDFEELDPEGVAGVADRDLGVEGLPAVVDWDDDNDDFITEEPAHSGGGVPPRELSRLLRKVLSSRQEHRIVELEADLQETAEKLKAMERELQLLREKAPAAGTVPESSESVAKGVSQGLVESDNNSWSAQIERLNQSVFEDQESLRDESTKSGIGTDSIAEEDAQKSSGEQIDASIPARQGHDESDVLESVASEPAYSVGGGSVESDPVPHLPARAASEPVTRIGGSAASEFETSGVMSASVPVREQESEPSAAEPIVVHGLAKANKTASSSQRSVSSLMLSEEDRNSEAHADNEAVCDEFLSSVFCSPDGSQLGLSSAMSSPLMDQMALANTPEEETRVKGVPDDMFLDNMATAVGDDLDQVVGQLLKKDSSSVKNAINAFLRWEASETDDIPSKDDVAEEETTPGSYSSRRTAGKHPTPQKTPVLSALSSAVTPQKTSVISSRLEQLARSAFTTEKMPYLDKSLGSAKRRGPISDEKSPRGLAAGGKALDVFQQNALDVFQQNTLDVFQQQPFSPRAEEKSPKRIGVRDYPLTRSPQSLRRQESGKSETSTTETLRDFIRGDSPVFGGAEKDFQSLLDKRREMRYATSKVQLSLTGTDTAPVFRQREDPNRAGTNSPIGGRAPSKNALQSPKLKHSRMALENRLYLNPTSDWLSEVGSPPDM